VRQLQADIREGYRWVVDLDLEAFFDRVNHDRLVARLKRGGWEGIAIRHVQKIAPQPGRVFRNGFFYTLVMPRCLTRYT